MPIFRRQLQALRVSGLGDYTGLWRDLTRWSLTGLRTPSFQLDLDKLQERGQETFEKVRDTMEAVTFRAANLNPDALLEMPKKVLKRALRQ